MARGASPPVLEQPVNLTFGELFAGVGGFSLGFEQAGWRCRWQVEWDKHCQGVLARHWPEVARYGDVQHCHGGELAPVDCITFGSPCQDLSVAGKRAGLAGERSGLFHEAIRIIKEMRDATTGTFPRYAIWENVAGALSSNKGDDFLAVIDAFAEIGAVDVAWRLVDAQFFGVPQRRRRVFVVADFGGECAGALHVEPAGVRWHPAAGRTAGPHLAASVGRSVTTALTAGLASGGPDFAHADAGWLVPITAGTLAAGAHPGSYNGQDAYNDLLVPYVKAKRASSPDDDETWRADGPAPTLNQFDNNSESRATVLAMLNFQGSKGNSVTNDGQISFSLNAMHGHDVHAVVVREDQSPDVVLAPTLTASNDPSRSPQSTEVTQQVAAVHAASTAVRRLTPVECERLMGWPDNHTAGQADSHRYKQCGNGVAAPVAQWVAQQLRRIINAD